MESEDWYQHYQGRPPLLLSRSTSKPKTFNIVRHALNGSAPSGLKMENAIGEAFEFTDRLQQLISDESECCQHQRETRAEISLCTWVSSLIHLDYVIHTLTLVAGNFFFEICTPG